MFFFLHMCYIQLVSVLVCNLFTVKKKFTENTVKTVKFLIKFRKSFQRFRFNSVRLQITVFNSYSFSISKITVFFGQFLIQLVVKKLNRKLQKKILSLFRYFESDDIFWYSASTIFSVNFWFGCILYTGVFLPYTFL